MVRARRGKEGSNIHVSDREERARFPFIGEAGTGIGEPEGEKK